MLTEHKAETDRGWLASARVAAAGSLRSQASIPHVKARDGGPCL
jgi:hypothetical protein